MTRVHTLMAIAKSMSQETKERMCDRGSRNDQDCQRFFEIPIGTVYVSGDRLVKSVR